MGWGSAPPLIFYSEEIQMDFETKVALIDAARLAYPSFEKEFNDYIGYGHSMNGAYNYFSIEHIDKHKPKQILASAKTDIDSKKVKDEQINVPTNNTTGNKKLPERKNG